jgi:hypothetical protein
VRVSNRFVSYGERDKEWTYVDDLKALLEKLVGLIWEVVLDTVLGCTVGLVDVNSFPGTAELYGPVADIGGCAADCVVEDEYSSCSSAAERY